MKRLECLDGLRGLLAIYVMLGHMAPFAAIPRPLAHALSHGGAAVDVFFILSGLVILRSLESAGFRARPFLITRVARIYPVYLVMFAVAVAVQPLPLPFGLLPWIGPGSPAHGIWSTGWPAAWRVEIVAHLGMLHGLLPDGVLPGAWVSFLGSAWSLSTEWQFYLLALLAGARLGSRRMAALLLAMAALGLAWQSGIVPSGIVPSGIAGPWHFSRAFLPNKAQFFALGIVSAGLLRREPGAAWRYQCVLLVTLALCLAQGGPGKLAAPLVWTLVLGTQAFPAHRLLRPLARLLRTPVLLRLGAWSYGIYLANEPIQKVLGIVLARFAAGNAALFTALWLPLALLLPLLAAAWLHHAVEAPALRLGRRLARAVGDGSATSDAARRAMRPPGVLAPNASAQWPATRRTGPASPNS